MYFHEPTPATSPYSCYAFLSSVLPYTSRHGNVGSDNVTTSLATVALGWLIRASGRWRKMKMEIPIIGGTSFHCHFPSYRHVTRTNTEYSRQPTSSSADWFPEHSRQEGRAQARRHDPTTLIVIYITLATSVGQMNSTTSDDRRKMSDFRIHNI